MVYIKLINIIIASCVFILLGIRIYNKIEYSSHQESIKNIIYDDYNTEYIGYIEIKRLGIKRGIVEGINSYVLNNNDVGYDIYNGNIVLAGHSIENIFGKLHKIKSGDIINLYINHKMTTYIVTSIKVVNKKDVDSLDQPLNLVTCMYNEDERLIIGAKKNT